MSQQHVKHCRCDECVLAKTDPDVRGAIVYELAVSGTIQDSLDAERRAHWAVARGLIKAGKLVKR